MRPRIGVLDLRAEVVLDDRRTAGGRAVVGVRGYARCPFGFPVADAAKEFANAGSRCGLP